MKLADKLIRWRDLQREADALAAEIKEEVMALRQTVKVEGAVATFSKGRGSFDYMAIAMDNGADDAIIKKYTVPRTDWRKVVLELGVSDDVRRRYYTPGTPYVSLKLKEVRGV